MIPLAWQTVRTRLMGLIGTIVALGLGVALLTTMTLTLVSTLSRPREPRWFTTPDMVVVGTNSVTFVTGSDVQQTNTDRAEAVPTPLAEQLKTLGRNVVIDYAGYIVSKGLPDGTTIHPWASSSLHTFTWIAGGPPINNGQVVLTAPTTYRPGDQLLAQTILGTRSFTVTGIIKTSAQAAVYVTDTDAAVFANNTVNAVALNVPASSSVAQLSSQIHTIAHAEDLRILTGIHRADAEPDPNHEQLLTAVSVLSITCGLAAFVSMFVVSSTFTYAVAARQRELGLLRAIGATPAQVRRMIIGEALITGTIAACAGSLVGTASAGPFAHWLARVGLAPSGFTAHFIPWPVLTAFGTGVLVACIGAWMAAFRAGRIRPAEALREAAVDRRVMTLVRWIIGIGAFIGAAALFRVFTAIQSLDAISLLLAVAMLLILGISMLAPIFIPPILSTLSIWLLADSGAVGRLARANVRTAVRRTAATVIPILLTLALAGSVLPSINSITATTQQATRQRIISPYMVVPATGSGLAISTATTLQATPGVTSVLPATDDHAIVYVSGAAGGLEDWTGRYIDGPHSAEALRIPVQSGTLRNLTGTDTIAVPAGSWRLGQTAHLWLGDASPVTLRVVAVFAADVDLAQTVLLPSTLLAEHTSTPLASALYISVAPDARIADIQTAAAAGGGSLLPTQRYISAAGAANAHENQIAIAAVLGMALSYTAISIANTLLMTTGSRSREFAALRLSGATKRQAVAMVIVETCLIVMAGVLLAAIVSAAITAGAYIGLKAITASVQMLIPWKLFSLLVGACWLIALFAAVVMSLLLLRRRPIELAGIRE